MFAIALPPPTPPWTLEAPCEPVDVALLDLGYEVAFPFLAGGASEPKPAG